MYLEDYYSPGYYDGIHPPGNGIWTPPPGGNNPPQHQSPQHQSPQPNNPQPSNNPGKNPDSNPGRRPETHNTSPGTPDQGGFRGMHGGSGASSTH